MQFLLVELCNSKYVQMLVRERLYHKQIGQRASCCPSCKTEHTHTHTHTCRKPVEPQREDSGEDDDGWMDAQYTRHDADMPASVSRRLSSSFASGLAASPGESHQLDTDLFVDFTF